MIADLKAISRKLSGLEEADTIDDETLDDIISRYPYFSAARYIAAKRASGNGADAADKLATATLYINNPLRLHWMLNAPEVDENLQAANTQLIQRPEEKQAAQSTDDSPITFQSYHTIDYFASQGIRLQQADLGKDKFGQQLRSFTDWLRSMKKLPATGPDQPPSREEQGRQQHVVQNAAHSLEAREVLTEAMAEVWSKQGNRDKAIAIYNKLSLQNPSKSDYFAAKIDKLKVS